jgi:threonine/homoserine efflux transporter RhtA
MSSLNRAIVRWSIIELIVVNIIGGWSSDHLGVPFALLYPASWLVYALAGREAARRGHTWHGVAAGAAVALVENVVWYLQGAPGHAETSDLPLAVTAMTYFTLSLGLAVQGAICGAVGAIFGRWARLRAATHTPSGKSVAGV